MAKEEISLSLDSLADNWQWIVLVIILLFGLGFRYYHIDYPVIGYHNWKESRYLQEARNFAENGFFEHGFFIAEYEYPGIYEDPSGAHGGEFPLLSILVGILFMVFGESLVVARLFVLLLSLGTIFMIYLLVKELFEREDIALASALAAAIMPLFVFFTHNVQVINLCILLMLLGAYFYVLWVKKNNGRDLVLAALFVLLAGISKYDFLVIGIPMLFIFPWKRLKDIKRFSRKSYPYIAAVAAFVLLIAQYFYFNRYIPVKRGTISVSAKLIDISVMFTSQWWATMKAYTADNYTILGFFIALFGIAFFLLFYQKKNLGYRFFLGYLAGTVLYVIVMSQKLGGHSYHQFAIAPLFAFMIAYCFVVVGTNISKIVKTKYLKPIIIIALFFVLYFPAAEAWNRQFNTQFFGLDTAGEYIKANSLPNERIIHSDNQDYGIFWYADRKGIDGGIPDLEKIKWAEDNLNIKWIFVYQWAFNVMQDAEKWKYIKDNYALKQIALINNQPIYLLFRRGGTFNESMLQNMTGTPHTKTYELTSGTVEMQWIDFN